MGHVRKKTGLGFIGVGVAACAAAAVPAGAAMAGTTYNSTASAIAGYVSVAGHVIPIPDNQVHATNGNSPQRAALGIGAIESALRGTPLGRSLKATLPTGLNVVAESASAHANGTSSACATLIGGDCTSNDKPQPITLSLSVADLPGVPSAPSLPAVPKTPLSGASGLLPGSAKAGSLPASPGDLASYKIVVTVAGPTVSCTAGPAGGSSGFGATADLARVTADIQQNGKSVLPSGGPVVVDAGAILGKLNNLGLPKQLNHALGGHGLPSNAIQLAIDPNSTSGVGTGPVTTATAGEVQLAIGGHEILHLIGAKATCGANEAAKTSGEVPMTGIQTDEGRSGGADMGLWLGVAGGVALAGTGGGLALWRRRRS